MWWLADVGQVPDALATLAIANVQLVVEWRMWMPYNMVSACSNCVRSCAQDAAADLHCFAFAVYSMLERTDNFQPLVLVPYNPRTVH